MADAGRYSYTPEDRLRLAEAGVVDSPDFEPVVYEVGSLGRRIASYPALDEAGDPSPLRAGRGGG